MFFGAVPDDVIQQILRIIDFSLWGRVYVCCSGGFRIERALLTAHPQLPVHSNDVSLFSGGIGALALKKEFPLTFIKDLAWMEEHLADKPFIDRVAASLVASDMARHALGKPNRFKRAHMLAYHEEFPDVLKRTRDRLAQVIPKMPIADYFGGDWRLHVDHAIAAGAGIAAFPPFFKGDYEKQFEYVHRNVDWPAPKYDLYDPKTLSQIVDKIANSGVPYCILTDQVLEGRKPVLEYVAGRKVPHYCYASTGHTSYRHFSHSGVPFAYKPVELERLTPKTKVRVLEADYKHVNFLKDVYLQKTIVHTPGKVSFTVWLDDMLVGAIVYDIGKFNTATSDRKELYLLSDVTTTREAKLSKFIARLATSHELVKTLERRVLDKFPVVVTTARSKNPVSMKYRGIYELHSRRESVDPLDEPGTLILQYHSDVRAESPQETYDWWWKSYGRKETERLAKARDRAETRRPEQPEAA